MTIKQAVDLLPEVKEAGTALKIEYTDGTVRYLSIQAVTALVPVTVHEFGDPVKTELYGWAR